MRNLDEVLNVLDENPEVWRGVKPHIRKDFMGWIRRNIELFNAFESTALHLRKYGKREYYSVHNIKEKLRWDSMFKESNPKHGDFKITNNCASGVSRTLMLLNPELEGMFRTRKKVPGKLDALGMEVT